MKPREIDELKITNVTFVHDPEAMKKWLELYVSLIKEVLLSEIANSELDQHSIY